MKASTTRIETNIWLKEATKNISGDVLSIGTGDDRDLEGSTYRNYFKSAKSFTTSDISDRYLKHDLILDVRDMSSVKSESFDAIFCACVIEHVDNFPAALNEMARVLKTGGTLLINFAFRQHAHFAPSDYWRFTIPAIKYLLEPGYELKEIKEIGADIKDFPTAYWVIATKMKLTELCNIAFKYGADKCPQINHSFTPFYYNLFKDRRNSIKKVLEIGIGRAKYMPFGSAHLTTGASLRMWRDFFPNAMVFGVDIQPDTLFQDSRIITYSGDVTKKEDLAAIIEKVGSDIDIFIDDCELGRDEQISTCRTVIPLLKKGAIYIIEDVLRPNKIIQSLKGYDCFSPELPNPRNTRRNKIVIVKN